MVKRVRSSPKPWFSAASGVDGMPETVITALAEAVPGLPMTSGFASSEACGIVR